MHERPRIRPEPQNWRSKSRQPWIFCAPAGDATRRSAISTHAGATIGCAAADFRPAHRALDRKKPAKYVHLRPIPRGERFAQPSADPMRLLSNYPASRRTVRHSRARVHEQISLDYSWAHKHAPHFQEIPR
jgi:hypothetical protein